MIINAKSRPPALNWEKITIVIPPPKKIFCRVQIQELIIDVKEDEGIKRRKEAGFDVHMVKPVDHDKLLEFLAALPPAGTARPALDDGERSQPIDR